MQKSLTKKTAIKTTKIVIIHIWLARAQFGHFFDSFLIKFSTFQKLKIAIFHHFKNLDFQIFTTFQKLKIHNFTTFQKLKMSKNRKNWIWPFHRRFMKIQLTKNIFWGSRKIVFLFGKIEKISKLKNLEKSYGSPLVRFFSEFEI